jgi:hypothetical protein
MRTLLILTIVIFAFGGEVKTEIKLPYNVTSATDAFTKKTKEANDEYQAILKKASDAYSDKYKKAAEIYNKSLEEEKVKATKEGNLELALAIKAKIDELKIVLDKDTTIIPIIKTTTKAEKVVNKYAGRYKEIGGTNGEVTISDDNSVIHSSGDKGKLVINGNQFTVVYDNGWKNVNMKWDGVNEQYTGDNVNSRNNNFGNISLKPIK